MHGRSRLPFAPKLPRATLFAYLSWLHDTDIEERDSILNNEWEHYFGERTTPIRESFQKQHPDLAEQDHHFIMWQAIKQVMKLGIAHPVGRSQIMYSTEEENVHQRDMHYEAWLTDLWIYGLDEVDEALAEEIRRAT